LLLFSSLLLMVCMLSLGPLTAERVLGDDLLLQSVRCVFVPLVRTL